MEGLARLAEWAVLQYRQSDEWDDIESEARTAALEAIRKYEQGWKNEFDIDTVVVRVARWAAQDYLRSTRAAKPYSRYKVENGTMPTFLSYEEIVLSRDNPDARTIAYEPYTNDFSEDIIQQVYTQGIWQFLKAGCTKRQYKYICRYFIDELTFKQVGEAESMSASRANQIIQDGLDHYRELVGLPLKGWKYRNRKKRMGVRSGTA